MTMLSRFAHCGVSSGVSQELNGWLRIYLRSPVTVAKEVRRLLDTDREAFYAAALRTIVRYDDSPGSRFLLSMLLDRGLLLRALCEPIVSEERMSQAIQALLGQDSASDVTLAKAVVEHAQARQPAGARKNLLRVIDHLDRLADAKRISPRLLALVRHPDPHLRSKAVGIVGRCGRNVQWLARQIADPDPRTRANAVEGLWGINSPEPRELLRGTLADSNNRVVGNALLGLYRIGVSGVLVELIKMAADESAAFRTTAAWAMGETGDYRFKDALKTLADDDDHRVRQRAATSLKKLEADAAKSDLILPWRVVTLAGPEDDTGRHHLHVSIQCADGSEPPALPATRFWPLENQVPVLDYSAELVEVADRLALAFLVPRMPDEEEVGPAVTGILRVVAAKRPQDQCAVVHYKPPRQWNLKATFIGEIIEIAPPDEIPEPVADPVFTADPDAAAAPLSQGSTVAAHSCIWDALLSAHQAGVRASAAAKPHMVIYLPGNVGGVPESRLEALTAMTRAVSLHCIAHTVQPVLQEMCERTSGSYHTVTEEERVIETLERLYHGLIARYRVTCPRVPRANQTEIQLRTPEGWVNSEMRYT